MGSSPERFEGMSPEWQNNVEIAAARSRKMVEDINAKADETTIFWCYSGTRRKILRRMRDEVIT